MRNKTGSRLEGVVVTILALSTLISSILKKEKACIWCALADGRWPRKRKGLLKRGTQPWKWRKGRRKMTQEKWHRRIG